MTGDHYFLSYHTKATFIPEQPITSGVVTFIVKIMLNVLERKAAKRDLKIVSERLAETEGPVSVLWNLHYAVLLGEEFKNWTAYVK